MKLKVYYDGQFWVGVVECKENGRLKAGRFLFGQEPKDSEILEFVQRMLDRVTERMSLEVDVPLEKKRRANPKRLAREAAQEMSRRGVSSFAQEALKLDYEKRKKERRVLTREQREEEKERKRELKRLKAKDKHRGK